MKRIEYLTTEDLLGLVRRCNIGPVRDLGLLDAAAARPRSSAFGEDAYPTLHFKAAALLHSIVTNHALVDGNKRLGWLATTVFLDMNNESVVMSDDDAFRLVLGTADGSLDVEDIVRRLSVIPPADPGSRA